MPYRHGYAWHAYKLHKGWRGRQKLDLHPRCTHAYRIEPPSGLIGEIAGPLARVGPPIRDLYPGHRPIGQVCDNDMRADGRRPMRRGRLMSIKAFTAGCQSPLPSPAVPGCHRGRQRLCPHGGQGWPVYHRPYQGTGDLWAAEEQAGHEHATSQGRPVQRPGSLQEVSPFLDVRDGVGYAYSRVWGRIPGIVRCVLLMQSADDEWQAVHRRINACDQSFHSHLHLSCRGRIHEVTCQVKQKNVLLHDVLSILQGCTSEGSPDQHLGVPPFRSACCPSDSDLWPGKQTTYRSWEARDGVSATCLGSARLQIAYQPDGCGEVPDWH